MRDKETEKMILCKREVETEKVRKTRRMFASRNILHTKEAILVFFLSVVVVLHSLLSFDSAPRHDIFVIKYIVLLRLVPTCLTCWCLYLTQTNKEHLILSHNCDPIIIITYNKYQPN